MQQFAGALLGGGVLVAVVAWFAQRFVQQHDEALRELRATCKELAEAAGKREADLHAVLDAFEKETLANLGRLTDRLGQAEQRAAELYFTRREADELRSSLREMDGRREREADALSKKLDTILAALLRGRLGEG